MLLTIALILFGLAFFFFFLSQTFSMIFIWCAVIVLKLFLVGSLFFSIFKSASDTCGKTVPFDRYVSGSWFCP